MGIAEKLRAISPLDLVEPDECCGKALAKSLQSGALRDKTIWHHEKCGCEWRARTMDDGSRYWYPIVQIWII